MSFTLNDKLDGMKEKLGRIRSTWKRSQNFSNRVMSEESKQTGILVRDS